MIRGIGLRGAVAVNVITMIGIGPLITIPLVLANLHGSVALVAWVAGAIIALCDGLAWAELGSLYPGSGGTYVFLRETFGRERWGRMLAFLFTWQIVLSAPLLLASGYIGFSQYAAYLWPAALASTTAQGILGAAVGVVTLVLLYRSIGVVGQLGVGLAGIAVATLAAVIAASAGHFSASRALSADSHVGFTAALGVGLGPALVITLYDYYGYGQSSTISDEIRNPVRVLPRSVFVSIVLVGLLYLALQVGVLGAIPWSELVSATPNGSPPAAATYVASTVVERVWGSLPARFVTVAILVTAFASTFGNLLGYSRIPYAAATDGLFFRAFAKLDERGRFPSVSLAVVGLLALPLCFLSLNDVIAALTAGLVVIQNVAQIVAVVSLRVRGIRAPYRMWLFPLPALIALCGWVYIFCSAGEKPIAFGVLSIVAGLLAFLVRAGLASDWPFAAKVAALVVGLSAFGTFGSQPAIAAPAWGHAATVERNGNPVFEVDGKPFFVYGAAFFYERLPRDEWASSLSGLRALGINTLDLYVPWNWHELSDGDFDFTGRTSPRRDLDEVLRLARTMDFKIILRPGPVVRNEWRNGGYPAWLLERPEYGMPLHEVLEGRYPATATLQNAHSDDAAAQWMANATHLTYAKRWLERVLHECEPDADRILAVALDDDQGAYIDNQTFPAPHFQEYISWLREVVHGVTGAAEPVFINTYQMKVTSSSPVWAMGNWYQSEAYSIGEHDRAQLAFSTGLLHTRPHQTMMASEFQAGWLEQAGDVRPRPTDPTNTSLALATMIGMGVRGVINFPAQDTLYPSGWEAPFANGFYAWDAALALDGRTQPRASQTAEFGALVRWLGPQLAASEPRYDAAIAYLGASYGTAAATNDLFGSVEGATIVTQQACRDANMSCALVDLTAIGDDALAKYPMLIVPNVAGAPNVSDDVARKLSSYGTHGIVVRDVSDASVLTRVLATHHVRRIVEGIPGASFARDTTNTMAGFLTVTNFNDSDLTVAEGASIAVDGTSRITLPGFVVPKHDAIVVPVALRLSALSHFFHADDRLTFTTCMPVEIAPEGDGRFDFEMQSLHPMLTSPACHATAHIAGANVEATSQQRVGFDAKHAYLETAVRDEPPASATPLPGIPIRNDALLPAPEAPSPPLGTATVVSGDPFRDGGSALTFDNGLVRVIVSEDAGGRAFVFEDEATERNAFTSVGALRDDVAVQIPPSPTDRIAKYTHDFSAGMFNRPYGATIATSGAAAVATLRYRAGDVLPNGATFTRTIRLLPNERSFDLDEHVDFTGSTDGSQQRAVSVTSLSVGDTTGAMSTQRILAPSLSAFAARTTLRVATGNALGYYDSATGEIATIAWRAGDVTDAAIEEHDRSIVVRLTFAANDAHVIFGYATTSSQAEAERALAGADAAAQTPHRTEKGTQEGARTL